MAGAAKTKSEEHLCGDRLAVGTTGLRLLPGGDIASDMASDSTRGHIRLNAVLYILTFEIAVVSSFAVWCPTQTERIGEVLTRLPSIHISSRCPMPIHEFWRGHPSTVEPATIASAGSAK
jgi:hypothetical protein